MLIRRYIACLIVMMTVVFKTSAQFEHILPKPDTAGVNELISEAVRMVLARQYDSAYSIYQFSFQLSRQIHYNTGIIRSLNGLGNVEGEQGKFQKSVYFLDQAIRFAKEIDDRLSLPYLYNNLAATYAKWGGTESAIHYYDLALKTSELYPEAEFPTEAIFCNIGYLLNNIGQYNQALYYLKKGISTAWYKGNFVGQALTYAHMGTSYLGLQQRDSATIYYKLALTEATLTKSAYTVHFAYKGLADVALKDKQPELAIYYLKQASLQVPHLNPETASSTSASFGEAYFQTGNTALARDFLLRALNVADASGLLQNSLNAHLQLAALYAGRRNWDSAFHHQQRAWVLSDSIHKISQSHTAQLLETRFRSALKDKELKEKQLSIQLAEKKLSARNLWIGISITGLIIACISIILLGKYHRNKQALKDANIRQLLRLQQLQEFRSILKAEEKERNRIARDLHDSIMVQFSVVKMNLSALAGKSDDYIDKKELLPHIEQLNIATQSLRNVAHHLMPDMLLEGGLAEALQYFCKSLQPTLPFKLRYEQMDEIPRFDIQIEIAIYRIVQELVQNIIKHADATQALVQISYNDNCLGIEVEDNGKGMHDQITENGMGLKNIATRVRHLNGHIHISSGEGTSISLEFNLDQLNATNPDQIKQTI